jgi:hypothetical protein
MIYNPIEISQFSGVNQSMPGFVEGYGGRKNDNCMVNPGEYSQLRKRYFHLKLNLLFLIFFINPMIAINETEPTRMKLQTIDSSNFWGSKKRSFKIADPLIHSHYTLHRQLYNN